MKQKHWKLLGPAALVAFFALATPAASDWPYWRGPAQNGVSDDSRLVSSWTPDGKNLIWKIDGFVGRSTPVVLNGRVYVAGRAGEGIDKQELLACYDAHDGKLLWERRFNVFLTTIPLQRVAWASPVGDPETGNVYFHGAQGLLTAFDKDGNTLWSRSLTEEFGRYSGYGGRTPTPIVDGDLLVINVASSGWGNQAPPRDRVFAFDKRTGELVWVVQPGGAPQDLNTYSTWVAATIKGQRLLIGGLGDGGIHALKAATGEKVWSFQLSKRGVNASVVVAGDRVYASHSEENLDEATLGRVVCIDATGSGDVTATHEVWRHDLFTAGFASPAIHNGRLYVVDNSANLHVLDAATGSVLWEHSLGTVGKASPVIADGKLWVPELNGALHIIEIGESGYTPLDVVHFKTSEGRDAEVYGSPAVAYNRVYLATEEGLFCAGDPELPFEAAASPIPGTGVEPAGADASPAVLQVTPAELVLGPGQSVQLRAKVFDQRGRFIKEVKPAWTTVGFSGSVDAEGVAKAGDAPKPTVGAVKAVWQGLEGSIRVRTFPPLPWSEDFEAVEEGKFPSHWIGAAGKFSTVASETGRTLLKPTADRGIQRAYVYVGPSDMKAGYTIEADLKGVRDKRRVPDMGLIANRYIVALEGNYQRLSVHSWAAEKRMYQHVDFPWDGDRWYHVKARVDLEDGKAVVRAKVWPRDGQEPAEWSIEAVDPHPNTEGAPGIHGQSYSDIHYDNLKISDGQGGNE